MTVPAFIVRNLTQLAILSSTVDGRKSLLQKSLSGLMKKMAPPTHLNTERTYKKAPFSTLLASILKSRARVTVL